MADAQTRLGIGFVGAGFVARFHIQSLVAVRDADVAGIFAPTRAHAEEAAALANELGVGTPSVHAGWQSSRPRWA